MSEPKKVSFEWIVRLLIAVLSAIAGMFGGNALF